MTSRHEAVPHLPADQILLLVDVVANAPKRSVEPQFQYETVPGPDPVQVVNVASVLHQAVDLGAGHVELTQDGRQRGAAGDGGLANRHGVGLGHLSSGAGLRLRDRPGERSTSLEVDPVPLQQHDHDQHNRYRGQKPKTVPDLYRTHRTIPFVARPGLYHRDPIIRPKRADSTLRPQAPGR